MGAEGSRWEQKGADGSRREQQCWKSKSGRRGSVIREQQRINMMKGAYEEGRSSAAKVRAVTEDQYDSRGSI